MFHSLHISNIFSASWVTWNDAYLFILLIFYLWTDWYELASLTWHLGRSLAFSTPNITLFTTYYHIGTRGDFWWLHFNITAPLYGVTLMMGMLSDTRRCGAKGNGRDFMGNIAATKTSLRRNRYIGSIIVAWGRRISVCVHIWGRFRYVKCADFTYVVFSHCTAITI
jgi:hypothetical protein